MDRVTMSCMVGLAHGIGVTTNNLTQVALALAYMGGNLEATIENFKAKIALAGLVCYNELHMFFVFFWLKLGDDWLDATLPFVDFKKSSVWVIDSPCRKDTLGMKQRSELESVFLACELTASFANKVKHWIV